MENTFVIMLSNLILNVLSEEVITSSLTLNTPLSII